MHFWFEFIYINVYLYIKFKFVLNNTMAVRKRGTLMLIVRVDIKFCYLLCERGQVVYMYKSTKVLVFLSRHTWKCVLVMFDNLFV